MNTVNSESPDVRTHQCVLTETTMILLYQQKRMSIFLSYTVITTDKLVLNLG